ncbi:MAG: hypothetical protein AAGI30_10225 [Planctomycetota bacterium]
MTDVHHVLITSPMIASRSAPFGTSGGNRSNGTPSTGTSLHGTRSQSHPARSMSGHHSGVVQSIAS